MPAIVLYLAVTIALVLLWDRYVQRMSRAAAIVLVLLPFCFTGKALLTGRVYAPIDMPFASEPLKDYAKDYGMESHYNGTLSDLYMQMIPWQSAVRKAYAQREWPLLNPYLLCGGMLAANMQSAPYDPVHLLALLLSEGQALTFGAAMTFFLAGLFTFAFARALGLGELAAILAAIAYMFSAMLAFFVGWPLGRVWAFLPLVMLGVRMVVHETNLRSAVVLTTAFVLMILAGHPESILHIVFVGAVWGAYEVLTTRRWKSIALAALCGALALLITAISLLPFFSVAPETREYEVRHKLYATAPFDIPAELIVRRAGVSLFPFWGEPPERGQVTEHWEPTSMRVGGLVLALALAALVAARRRDTWFFFALAAFCACAGLNAWPVGDLLHGLPLFNIALNERLVFPAAFAIAILAAIATDAVSSRAPSRDLRAERSVTNIPPGPSTSLGMTIGVILATGIALLAVTLFVRDSQIAIGVDAKLITFLALVDLIPIAIAAAAVAWKPRAAVPLLVALVLIQRALEDGAIYPAHPEKAFYPNIPILQQMQKDGDTPFRMVALHYGFLPDAAALYGLEDARGYEAMTFRRLSETYPLWCVPIGVSFNNVPDMSKPFLSFLNIRYAVTTRDNKPAEGWEVVLADRGSHLLRNTRALPRAFVPPVVHFGRNAADVLGGMVKATDFTQKAWIEVADFQPGESANGPGTVALRRNGFDYELDASMENDGWVVLSDAAWPGWRVYVDGKRQQPHFANHAFLGMWVPKGRHKVRVAYRPEAFTRGRNITFVTLAGIAVFLVVRKRRLANA